jgi:hypothetical protein
MNKNKIHELAEQAGLLGPSSRVGNAHEAAEKFAELIIEECAKACVPRPWGGLTEDERSELVTLHHKWNEYGQAIEAKLKEKNT